MRLNRKEIFLLVPGTLLALAGLRADDAWIVFPCLVSSCFLLIGICYLHDGPGWARVASAFATICIFSLFIGRIYFLRLVEEQKDVFDHLEFKAALSSPDKLNTSVITVTNGSHTAIQYRFVCRITWLVANSGTTVIRDSSFRNHERAGMLDSGSDAQADECLSDIMASTQILDCIDISARLFYSLESQPNVQKEKDHGFLAVKRGDRIEWEDRATNQEVSDCAKFVRVQSSPTPDEPDASMAKKIKAENDAILETHGSSSQKKGAALLSNEVFQFGIDEQPNAPKPLDFDKSTAQDQINYRKEFGAWGRTSSARFHAAFDLRIERTLELGRKAKIPAIYIQTTQANCSMISEGFPPSSSMTTRCAAGIGQIAAMLPDR